MCVCVCVCVCVFLYIYGEWRNMQIIKQVEKNDDNIGALVLFLFLQVFCKNEIIPNKKLKNIAAVLLILTYS